MSPNRFDAYELDGSVSTDHYYLAHVAVGVLELGMSSYFRWRTKERDFKGAPGYLSDLGLYVTWQREDHALQRRIAKALASGRSGHQRGRE
jgi:hypothetical protein